MEALHVAYEFREVEEKLELKIIIMNMLEAIQKGL
jgi:hypothetical protein